MLKCFVLSVLFAAAFSLSARDALIIDHKCINISNIPKSYFSKAGKKFKIAYGHTSHGSQIVAGMYALKEKDKSLFDFNPDGSNGSLSFWDRIPPGDLGNPNRRVWAERTWEFLKGRGSTRNMIIWSWCGQAGSATPEEIDLYLGLMNELEKTFPNVTFVYMTGHLNGSGLKGKLYTRNEQIRNFCRKNGKVLFDFADIESYDPDGKVNYNQYYCRDNCTYINNGHRMNWAEQWLKRNPHNNFALPDRAAHTHPLNAAMKGQAFWYMLARLAGWKPGSGLPPKIAKAEDSNVNCDVTDFSMPVLRREFERTFKFNSISDYRYWREVGTPKSLIPEEDTLQALIVPSEKKLAIALLRGKYLVNELEFKADLERGKELCWYINSDFKNDEYAGIGVGGIITPYKCRLIVGHRSYDLPFVMPGLKARNFHSKIVIKGNKLIWGLNNKIVCEKELPAGQLFRKGECGIGGVKSKIRINGVYVKARY